MNVIYKKELKSFLNGMMGYVFISFSLAVIGIYTFAVNLRQSYPNFEYALDSVRFIFLLLIPMLTMRTISEERRQRTEQLLLSSPISTWSVVWCKFFAAATVYSIPLAVCCAYPLVLSRFGDVNFKTAYAGILGFLLMGSACIAIGIFLSSLTESQMVAAILCFGALVIAYLMPSLSNMISASALTSACGFSALIVLLGYLFYSSTRSLLLGCGVGAVGLAGVWGLFFLKRTSLEGALAKAMNALAVFSRYDDFVHGIFNLTTILYFLTIIFLFVFFTVQVIEKRRWS